MALNLGYYLEKDTGTGGTPRLRKFRNTSKGPVADLNMGDEDPMVIGADPVTNSTSFKSLTPNDGGATSNGVTDMPLLNVDIFKDPAQPAKGSSASDPIVDSSSKSVLDSAAAFASKQSGATYARAGLGIIQGYMKADAIRSKANYEADILQLNADMQMFEAGEQQGVDFTKIIRYGEQVDAAVSDIQSEFVRQDQEGGAAQDLIAENTLQGRLNQMAMMNEAQAKVSSAEFAKKLSYLKAKQAREISKKQGQQAIQAGYLETALMFAGM